MQEAWVARLRTRGGLPNGAGADGVGGSHRIVDASAMHRRRRRCLGALGATKVGLRPEPQRRCIGDAARSSGPIYSDPI
eukprot:1529792-Pyramimonas_sp.AAC.1